MSSAFTRKQRLDNHLARHPHQDLLVATVATVVVLAAAYVAIQLACLGLDALGGHWHGWLAHVTWWTGGSNADNNCHSGFPC